MRTALGLGALLAQEQQGLKHLVARVVPVEEDVVTPRRRRIQPEHRAGLQPVFVDDGVEHGPRIRVEVAGRFADHPILE